MNLTTTQQEVWKEIQWVAEGKPSYDFSRRQNGEIYPNYGARISRATLRALEREGLIRLTQENANYFVVVG